MSFALLDTPEYENLVAEMVNVTNTLWFDENNNYCYDIKSGLVFEFSCVVEAIERDEKQFIIFDYNDGEITVHTHKDNVDILLALICRIDNPKYEISKSVIPDIVGDSLSNNYNYIKWCLGKVHFDYQDVTYLVTKLRK